MRNYTLKNIDFKKKKTVVSAQKFSPEIYLNLDT